MIKIFSTLNALCQTVDTVKKELLDTKQALITTQARVAELDELARDATVKATNSCRVSDKDLTGLKNQVHSIEVRVTNLCSARKDQSNALRDIRKKVKQITPTPAQPTPTKTSPMNAPERDASQTSSGETNDTACTGDIIPVIVTTNRPAARSDDLTSVTSNPPGHSQSHAAPSRRPTPADNLARRRVLEETDHLIVGDSILRRMSGRKMVCRRDERVQIISVSGMSAKDLLEWLTGQPEAPHVRVVTFHVGINDCKRGEVTSRMWDDLIKQCRRTFPGARLQASTVLPVRRARCGLSESVTMSNANLTHACRKHGVYLIENTKLFAPHGKPQLALYCRDRHDIIHLSHQGMVVLAQNIREAATECAETDGILPNNRMPSQSIPNNISEQLTKLRAASGTQAATTTASLQGHAADHVAQWSYLNHFTPHSHWYGMYRPPVGAFYYQRLPLYN